MGKIRGTHSSPGVYSTITDLQYAANSLGITTLGLVGETKKGPAFEPVAISNWNEFVDYFGGTSTEKFKDTLMPKYELPYIAKSYLSASNQMYVCRVLGLSGYNAGPAWAIYGTDSGNTNNYLVAILRSRGSYDTNGTTYDKCSTTGTAAYDTLTYYCTGITLGNYSNSYIEMNCDKPVSGSIIPDTTTTINVTPGNYGRFILKCNGKKNDDDTISYEKEYSVSLNAGEKDYIYNVLGSDANNGSSMLFVEALYDMELRKLVDTAKITELRIVKISEKVAAPICDPVSDFLTIKSKDLTRKDLGKTFLCNSTGTTAHTYYGYESSTSTVFNTGVTTFNEDNIGQVFKVVSRVNENNIKEYVYAPLRNKNVDDNKITVYNEVKLTTSITNNTYDAVKLLSDGNFYYMPSENEVDIMTSIGNYREQFRHAMTPWFVSELKGDSKNIELKKLFRFHTISDGKVANEEVKVTIANIRPDEGTFDVLIRDFNDSDGNQVILEAYRGVNMVPGNSKYIGLKIGTLNGDYERKSKYVVVEVIENETTETCMPCGFMGYPVGTYIGDSEDGTGVTINAPSFTYNEIYDENVNVNKQCFGLSDLTGIDVDMLYYKGYDADNGDYTNNYTNGFHLDCNLSVLTDKEAMGGDTGVTATVKVDGIEVPKWSTVSVSNVTADGYPPVMGDESQMEGTIYENVKLRKFTCCFYGGFDGWDPYRGSRTNTNEFRANKYKGEVKNGYGATFNKIMDGEGLNLDANAISSDYYAYLAGYKQFENTEKYVINLFATPGIDYVNNKMLTDDVLDMIHERQDTFYVVTTPDKPAGASESTDEMYSPSDVVANLEDSNLDTYYASTYYPWVRYYDAANAMYISLPVTKDVLRNMANVDNKKYPWYAPAGIERGNVDCTKARIYTKIEDEDTVYDGRINPVKTFSVDGVKIWGNKTLYSQETPMNRINTVRLVLYMRKLIIEASRILLFEPNDITLKNQFDGIIRPILNQIKADRGITDFKLQTSQTPEQMDAHEISASIFIKPSPSLEYIELDFVVTPQGVQWDE